MARRKMNLMTWVLWVAGIVASLGIAGLFWAGGFLAVPVLSWLPLWVHKVVAVILWLSIAGEFWEKVSGTKVFR